MGALIGIMSGIFFTELSSVLFDFFQICRAEFRVLYSLRPPAHFIGDALSLLQYLEAVQGGQHRHNLEAVVAPDFP